MSGDRVVDAEVVPLLNQISDRAEKSPIGRNVEGFTFAGTMPFVDLRLQSIALGQQRAIPGGEVVNDAVEFWSRDRLQARPYPGELPC